MEAEEIISKILSIKNDVYTYIVNTEHWMFYWITNREVQDMIEAYPEDYEDYISLNIDSVKDTSIVCKISFYNHPDDISSITRYAVLQTFRDSVKARWMEWNGKIKDLQISEKEEELAYYKKKVAETEEEIKKLKSK